MTPSNLETRARSLATHSLSSRKPEAGEPALVKGRELIITYTILVVPYYN